MKDTAGPYSIGSDVWPGLAKLVEEMGELTQELMKLVAVGGDADTEHWDGRGPLRGRILDEMSDVRATLTFFGEANELPQAAILWRTEKKLERFRKWHKTLLKKAKSEGTTDNLDTVAAH